VEIDLTHGTAGAPAERERPALNVSSTSIRSRRSRRNGTSSVLQLQKEEQEHVNPAETPGEPGMNVGRGVLE